MADCCNISYHNKAQLLDKEKNYFEVEAILEHRNTKVDGQDVREFLVSWKGDGYSNTWEPEENLDGCISLLQNYLLDLSLPLSKIKGLLGKTGEEEEVNRNNWCTIEDIIGKVQKYQSNHFKDTNLDLGPCSKNPSQDGIYFVDIRNCYVALYIYETNIAYVADGSNSINKDHIVAEDMRKFLGTRVQTCTYKQKTRVDHCASSAVLIKLEFIRAYRNQYVPKTLTSPRKWLIKIRGAMHKYKSTVMELEPLHKRRQFLCCVHCGMKFPANKGRNHRNHEMRCKST